MRRYNYAEWERHSLEEALHHIRCKVVRDKMGCDAEIDAVVRAFGVDPETLVVPKKHTVHHKRRELRSAVMEALKDGPKSRTEVAQIVTGETRGKAFNSACRALYHVRDRGLVEQIEGKWRMITPPAASSLSKSG